MGLAESWEEPRPLAESVLVLETSAEPVTLRALVGRSAELAVASIVLLLTSPLLLMGILMVAVSDGFPIFFGHERLGKGGVTFRCWKLRTMRTDAEERLWADSELHRRYIENGFKIPSAEDPRIILGGTFLRRFYLDELPQLWNVIRGDLSLVGPRPVVPRELALFGAEGPRMLRRRPGVFGEWTARGRARPAYPERVKVEMEYVQDPSFTRTLRILVKSVGVIVRGQEDQA